MSRSKSQKYSASQDIDLQSATIEKPLPNSEGYEYTGFGFGDSSIAPPILSNKITRVGNTNFVVSHGVSRNGAPIKVTSPVKKSKTLHPILQTTTGTSCVAVLSVKDVQRALNTLGFCQLPETGKLDAATVNCIKNFQSQNGMAVTGNATTDLRTALSKCLAAIIANSNITIPQNVPQNVPNQNY